MQIMQAVLAQREEVFSIYRECKAALEQEGIYQWMDSYPNSDTVSKDIEQGHLFCLFEDGRSVGAICLNEMQDEEYNTVNWQENEGVSMVIHRLAVLPNYQGKGLARQLMDFAEAFARQKGYASIRLDAYTDNKRSLHFYEKRGYMKRGEVYFPGRTAVFYCYELVL